MSYIEDRMTKTSKTNIISKISFSLLFLWLLPLTTGAQEPIYSKIVSHDNDQVIIKFYQIGSATNYLCSLKDFSCTNHGASAPELEPDDSDLASARVAKFGKALPAAASFKKTSSKGTYVAFYTSASEKRNHTRTFNLWSKKTGKKYTAQRKVNYWDLLSEENRLFDFTPDETKLIYLSDREDRPTLYSVNLKTLNGKLLAGSRLFNRDYNVADFLVWDNQRLFFLANRDNPYDWSVYEFNLQTRTLKRVSNNASYTNLMEKVGKYLVFSKRNKNVFEPVFYDPIAGKSYTVNAIKPTIDYTPAAGEVVKTGKNYGVLLKPTNWNKDKRYPLVIWLHGGPYRQTANGYHPYQSYGVYDEVLEKLRQNGVIVLKLDYHGSYGYGRKYAEAISGQIGKLDVTDVLQATDAIKTRYKTNQTYLMGNSYGGYLALRTLTERPTIFAGAISINGVTDWESLIADIPTSIFATHFGGVPESKNQKLYNQASIINRAKNLAREKIVIMQSQADNSVPRSQADVFYASLMELGKNVEYVKYEGEDHVFKKRASLDDICRRTFNIIGVPENGTCAAH